MIQLPSDKEHSQYKDFNRIGFLSQHFFGQNFTRLFFKFEWNQVYQGDEMKSK